jgi:hypothetical protein
MVVVTLVWPSMRRQRGQIQPGLEAVGGEAVAQGILILPMNCPSQRSTTVTTRSLAKK